MEGETTEQDYNKFEALLGKISNETSENSLAEGFDHLLASEPITDNNSSSPQAAYRENSMSSYCDLSYLRWLENNGMIDASVSDCETSACIAGLVNPYLVPQSLALSLEQLGLNDGEERVPSSPAPVTSLNGFSRYMLPSVLRSEEVSDPPYPVSLNGARPSNAALNGYSPFTGQEEYGRHNGMINQDDAGFNQPNASEQVNQRSEALFDHLQSYPVCSTRIPVNPGMHRYQYLHGVPAQELEFRPSPSYLPQQYLGQFDRDWQNVGDEGYYRRTSTPSLQDLQDDIHRVRNGTNGTGSFSGNMKHSYMMGPTPSQMGIGKLNTRWNDIPSSRGYYQQELLCNGVYRYFPQELRVRNENRSQNFTYASGLTCSTKGSHRHQVSDKVGNQISPESILTRSYGVDSLRSLRSDSIISNRPRCYVDNYVRDFSNGDSSLLLHRNRASDLDGQNSRNLSPDNYDFRHASKSFQLKFKSLDDVVGRIYTLARDQDGCRFLQNKFTEGTSEDVERIFAEIIDGIVELMTDPFGNYLVQKLLEVCNEDQRAHLLQRITRTTVNLIEISCNTHGSRAVQKIIETLKTKEQFSMIASSLESDALSLIKDINGTHVAQRCLQYLSPADGVKTMRRRLVSRGRACSCFSSSMPAPALLTCRLLLTLRCTRCRSSCR